jgi:hypothetical protein
MKDYEEYSAIDWIIRDLMIEIQRLKKQVILLGVGLTIVGIIGIIF